MPRKRTAPALRLSWHTIGRVGQVARAAMLPFFIFWIAAIVRPQSPLFVVGAAVFLVPLVVAGVGGAVIALSYFAGWLKITCPLCGGDGVDMTSAGSGYTYFRCPNCGNVHSQGRLRVTYTARRSK